MLSLAVLFCDQENPFWISTVESYGKVLCEERVEGRFFFPSPSRDREAQARLFQEIDGKSYDSIIVNPIDGENLIDPILSSRDIPIFDVGPKCTQQSLLGCENYIPLYVTDFEEQGTMAMKAMSPFIDGGPVGFIGGPSSANQGRDRIRGALEEARSRGFDLLEPLWSDFTYDGGRRAMEDLLPSNPSALFCANDVMALGALEVLEREKITLPVGSVDMTEEAKEAVRSGRMTVTVGIDKERTVREVVRSVKSYLKDRVTPARPLVQNEIYLLR